MHGRFPMLSPSSRSDNPKSKIENPKLLWLIVLAFVLMIAGVVPMAMAQQPKKVPRIGYLAAVSPAADAPRKEAFRQALRDFGYIEGQNILIEYRHEDRNFDRLPELAAELVRLKTDVFVTVTTNAAQAARSVSKTIPHVFMGVTDPVTAGLVDSLPRPGGNRRGSPTWRLFYRANDWSYSRKSYPSSPALPCCGTLRLQALRRSGKTARCRHGSSVCSFIQ